MIIVKRILVVVLVICFYALSPINTPELSASGIDLKIIRHLESSGRSDAYNPTSGAIGLYQVCPNTCLADYNQFHLRKFNADDLYDPSINKEVASWYFNERIPQLLTYYGQDLSTQNVLICYHAGIGNLVRGNVGNATRTYVERYEALTKEA